MWNFNLKLKLDVQAEFNVPTTFDGAAESRQTDQQSSDALHPDANINVGLPGYRRFHRRKKLRRDTMNIVINLLSMGVTIAVPLLQYLTGVS